MSGTGERWCVKCNYYWQSCPCVDPPPRPESEAEQLAKKFHEAYERLAPQFGYSTRQESAVPWDQVPAANKRLMIAVCQEVFCE